MVFFETQRWQLALATGTIFFFLSLALETILDRYENLPRQATIQADTMPLPSPHGINSENPLRHRITELVLLRIRHSLRIAFGWETASELRLPLIDVGDSQYIQMTFPPIWLCYLCLTSSTVLWTEWVSARQIQVKPSSREMGHRISAWRSWGSSRVSSSLELGAVVNERER